MSRRRLSLKSLPSLWFLPHGLLCMEILGCGGASTPNAARGPARAPLPPIARYLPVEDGTVYAYRAEDWVEKSSGILVLRVRRRAGGGADLIGGVHPQHLRFEAEGIRREPSGFFLLRAPLVVGNEWSGGPGARVRIARIEQTVRVPAGSFAHCVEIEEERSGGASGNVGNIRTTFCPDVGIVSMESQGTGPAGALIHERYELRSFGKAVDLRDSAPLP